ncbi:hypothetical protein [Blastococcus saxobsidens]|uniref:Uncharacterized protein n=1 Tax=Blastococcus saxobsidens (strain DD2) TaxID=1146883 RepID=H6RRC1_BLASD|nr:hypothetical protein [Blastococcus saxobsidens]CCG05403.1 conserved exported protein of unknown function [Blastococcus saxobsidens DD2]
MPGELLAVAGPLLGCFGLIALVVVLAAGSTARYEFERNGVRALQPAPAHGEVPVRAGTAAGEARRGAQRPAPERSAVGLATHPAGRHIAEGPSATAWWLVDQADGSTVAGPFADRLEADWALWSAGLAETASAVHGVRRPDGGVVRRQSPQEREWLAELGRQLDRLPEDWEPNMADDEDALATVAVELTAALLEAGLPVHGGAGPEADGAGGVCLMPHPAGIGVLVTWRQHDRMSVQQVRGAAMEAAVQRTMTAAVATVLRQMGFPVEEFGSTGAHLVTAPTG